MRIKDDGFDPQVVSRWLMVTRKHFDTDSVWRNNVPDQHLSKAPYRGDTYPTEGKHDAVASC